jgi:predicted amidohydrolase YtcJ
MHPQNITAPSLADFYGSDIKIVKAKKIITMTREPVEALAMLAGQVIAAGGISKLKQVFPEAPITDFGENIIVPGFNDAHIHLAQAADLLLYLDVSPDTVSSIEDIKREIGNAAQTKSTGSWIRGVRYDDAKTKEKRILTRWDLDEVALNHPVLVIHVAGHWGIANSCALAAGNVDQDASPPEGGEFGREADGKLNGVLYEKALFNFAYPQLAPEGQSVMPALGFEERISGLERAVQLFHAAGLTSVCDALVGPDDLRLFTEGLRRGLLTLRVNMLVAAEHYSKMRSLGLVGKLGGDRLRICGIKTFVDGAVGGRTCLMEQPFEGSSDDYGIQSRSTAELRDIVQEGHENGTQVCIHANGDRAIKLVLNLYEEAQTNKYKPALRHRIEHCTIVNEDIVQRIKRLNAFVIPFGSYVHYHGAKLLDWYGDERVQRMFAHKWFFDSGIAVAGSSDFPCGPYQPLRAIQSCVTRQGFDGAHVGVNQKVTVREALWLYTVGAALSTGQERTKGRLAPGFSADFVVLEQDPFTVDPNRIAEIPVSETWVGGQKVWHKNANPVTIKAHGH